MLLLDRPYQEWECKPIMHMLSRRAWTTFPESDNIAIDGITLEYRANLAGSEARPLLKVDMNTINDDQPKILIVYL